MRLVRQLSWGLTPGSLLVDRRRQVATGAQPRAFPRRGPVALRKGP